MNIKDECIDRAIGCFIGLAIGDALGAPVEFKEPGEFEPVTDYRAGGAFRLEAGYWTDDTSMALCLADSIIEHNDIVESDIILRFCRWYRNGENSSTGRCFDIGNQTRKVLDTFMRTKEYHQAKNDFFLSGNGCIMRLAPVAVRWYNDEKILIRMSRLQSMTTHGADICLDACEELAILLGKAIRGENVIDELKEFAIARNNVVPKTGYVVDTMIAAKWAVGSTTNFEDAVLAAANLGGDADTIAAVAGQIAGAIYGKSSIRHDWIDRLHESNRLLKIATDLII